MKRWILHIKTGSFGGNFNKTCWLISPSGDKIQLDDQLNIPEDQIEVVNRDEVPTGYNEALDLMEHYSDFKLPDATIPVYFTQRAFMPWDRDDRVEPSDFGTHQRPPDPWPILPERSNKQERDDLIAVSWLLYNINHEQTKLIAQGKIRPLAYNPVEPSRTISRKSDGA